MSLYQWLLYHQQGIVFEKCTWMGARALKNPLDAWIYQEIIYEVKPDVIVEIGSAYGGSALFLAHMLDLIGTGIVISVDITRELFNVKHDRIVLVTGDSSSAEVVAQVADLCRDKRVLVIHDGSHVKEDVLKDLQHYSKCVNVGSYIIVEDGIVDLFSPRTALGRMYDGPLLATEQFLKEQPNFEVDSERERYILTYNPKGFLKRVR
ncbi:MAG: CmcI family methyltransferase [Aggregatilineales bacterium]